ncbi:hypothetical protein SAY87_017453 [Trapa incisa]|uniref:DNA-directed RNA polymerase III subunit RPC4 n=1 Tax=Trapa incisa TaxID=236973 RepID=A0AAN7L1L7_9MYRT|nr:hypothetical protein SAY87_017453 [Trapa incisa]
MDDDDTNSAARKVKFKPKAPSRRKLPSVSAKTEAEEDEGASAEAAQLLSRFNDNLGKQRNKVPKESSVQVAFDQGVVSSTPIRTYGVLRDVRKDTSISTLPSSPDYDKGTLGSLPLTAKETTFATCSDVTDGLPQKTKEYREAWDYAHSYYPTSLPLRPSYSGNPEILDEAEFGESARNMEYDENLINAASELALLEESEEERMLFFQFPPKLPTVKKSDNMKGQERSDFSSSSNASCTTGDCKLEDLPEGYMGKLLVYKSGKIRLKLGETSYDVSPGLDCIFPQNVVAVNAVDRKFCILGDIEKRAIVTPDIDSILDTAIDMR